MLDRSRRLYFAVRCYIVFLVAKREIGLPSRRATKAAKRPGRNRRIVQWLVVFVASVFVVDGLVGDRGLLATMRARREYDTAAAAVARQRAENARLREQARRLREEPDAIEEIARRELGLIRPGEKVFIIKDVPPAKQ
jgi:cell division protein FtsB